MLGDLGMFGAGVALVGFRKWLARSGVAWVSNAIRTAFGVPVVVQASAPPAVWFDFFGAVGLTSIFEPLTSSQFQDIAAVRGIFCVLSLIVPLYWGWWRYAQRVHLR